MLCLILYTQTHTRIQQHNSVKAGDYYKVPAKDELVTAENIEQCLKHHWSMQILHPQHVKNMSIFLFFEFLFFFTVIGTQS